MTTDAASPTGFVDLHAHVLASVDDGPATLEDAVDVLRVMTRQGVTMVAATSHVASSFPNRASDLAAAHRHVVDAALEESLPITVLRGAEIELQMAMTLPDAELNALCTEGTRWLLVETPHSRYPAGLADVVSDLRARGFEVLVAHPERNPYIQENHLLIEAAVTNGALVQLTGASLRGALGRRAESTAWQLLEGGLAHVVASDAHNTRSRPPDMDAAARAVAERCGPVAAEAVTRAAPSAIIAGEAAEDARLLTSGIGRLRVRRRRWALGRG